MDLLQKLGGRKFLVALAVLGIGLAVELQKSEGISPTFATFLASIVAAFSAANYAVTKQHMSTKGGANIDDKVDRALEEKMDEIVAVVRQASDPQVAQDLLTVLTQMRSGIEEVKESSLQLGQAMVNTQKVVSQSLLRK